MTFVYNNSGKYRMAETDGMINFADFGSYELADLFVTCFNSYLQSYGKVLFTDISVMLDHDVPKELVDSYIAHGYVDEIDSGDIRTLTNSETGVKYRVCFPMHVKDFSAKEVSNA